MYTLMASPAKRDQIALLIGAPVAKIDDMVHIESHVQLAAQSAASISLPDLFRLVSPVGWVIPTLHANVSQQASAMCAQDSEVSPIIHSVCKQPIEPIWPSEAIFLFGVAWSALCHSFSKEFTKAPLRKAGQLTPFIQIIDAKLADANMRCVELEQLEVAQANAAGWHEWYLLWNPLPNDHAADRGLAIYLDVARLPIWV